MRCDAMEYVRMRWDGMGRDEMGYAGGREENVQRRLALIVQSPGTWICD